ncbi:tRNA lysidine(34) synthetase TilS [Rhabdochromatium marinum]|uniref:tRNA lysidine(34) synthetase TilS n=1 Tax=Rhabdochromatium marinum TaxID=48729 RepID=UPI00190610E9|nr:tRNA lysidine(34) synthetase TilS [Rhabdochromatium marinum]
MNGCAGTDASKLEALRQNLSRQAPSPTTPDRPHSRLWIAYSGGRDSHALLHAAATLPALRHLALSAVHIDHGLHPHSGDWAEHCRQQCAMLHVPLKVQRVQVAPARGQSLEEAARLARWTLWETLLAPGEQLWLAQHQDDQAETLLLALLRGAGVAGLAAMPRARALGAGQAVRPWLECPGAWIAAYASAQRLSWIEDPSNQDTRFDRNHLRHRILPLLRARWPAASATLARSAAHCAEAQQLLDRASADWLTQARATAAGSLSIQALQSLSPEQQHAVLRHWLAQGGFRMPSQRRLEAICHSLLQARAGAQGLVAWSGCEVRRYRDQLFALPPLPAQPAAGTALRWDLRQPLVLGERLGELSVPASPEISEVLGRLAGRLAVDCAPQLQVRFAVSGLRCRVRPGAPSRTLKALFQQVGVPAWLRPYVPMLFAGEHLLAIAGVALCDARLPVLRWQHALGCEAGLSEFIRYGNTQ